MRYQAYLFFIVLELFSLVSGDITSRLRHYEVIHSSDVSHDIKKRSLPEENDHREITLSVFGRKLEMSLAPRLGLFSEEFRAVTVDKDGNEREFSVDRNEFYRGFVRGEERNSSVIAHVDGNMITASIETDEDTYHLEPAAGHVEGDTSNKMIAYRESDIIWNLTFARNHSEGERFCGMETHASEKNGNSDQNKERERRSTRDRRSLVVKRDCKLVLVADHHYFEHIGRKTRRGTTNSMVSVIDRVDGLFRKTDWSTNPKDPYRNFGFVIKKIIIHEEAGIGYARNLGPGRVWNIKDLLEEFSRRDWSKFCLAHLFTYQDFANGVIGLAYVAHPEGHSKGGICSEGDRNMWHNTGLSSSINWGAQLLTAEADIVTAHELGHNFGSAHDVQDDPICSPSDNGKYIMYPASVSGRRPNNKLFSPCSRRDVEKVLRAKSSLCFALPNESEFCGNYRVKGDEQCDTGGLTECCDSKCRFIGNATCTLQAQCCTKCQFATTATLCANAQPLLCKNASYCDGKSDKCPEAPPATPGTDCIERGKCNEKGECVPFCKAQRAGYEPCLCTTDEDACFICCKKNDSCKVFPGPNGRIAMSDGRFCYNGVCSGGKCKKTAQDIITRLQDFFDTLGNPSKFGELLKNNIVGTVIIFSLFAWIPISIVVHRIDKRRDKQAQEFASWQDTRNQDLIRHPQKRREFDVVFKKNEVILRDSRKARGQKVSPNRARVPVVES